MAGAIQAVIPTASLEVMPLENAMQAYRRMKSGDVRIRMVMTMTQRTSWH
ncbi:hypothetical protein K7G19_24605 [Cupriavidus sp. DB3]|jgi:Zn-dependent alcohol dehydrogenases|nr:hypothetical protein [Cupriavidus sp. DB3]MCA7086772.1 hypothetical protein [Cupriavidus sp. DB3]